MIDRTWDEWLYVLAKSPKRTPRVKGVYSPTRTLTIQEQQMIIDLIRSSDLVIGVDAKLLIKNN